MASGTATLEAALLVTPMSIIYKVNLLSYSIIKRMIKIKYIGLANIVAGKEVVPEFIQKNAEPHIIATEVIKQLENEDYRNNMVTELQKIKSKLGEGSGSSKIAVLANECYKAIIKFYSSELL